MAPKFELEPPNTRVTLVRSDGTDLVIEQGKSYEPKDGEELLLLEGLAAANHATVKQVGKGGKD